MVESQLFCPTCICRTGWIASNEFIPFYLLLGVMVRFELYYEKLCTEHDNTEMHLICYTLKVGIEFIVKILSNCYFMPCA